jgi:F-type H+-transporting ATPase subunit delta
MAELSTIARPYAQALFDAASADAAAGGLGRWLELVEQMGAVARHPQVASVVSDPKLGAEQTYALITGLLRDKLPAGGESFLRLVIDNGRLAALPEVARQFRRLKNQAEGRADCLIETALPISAEQVGGLLGVLAKKFGVQLIPEVRVDESLIGGVRITVGDHVLDSSVRGQLAAMKTALTA